MNHCDELTGLLYLDGQLDDGQLDAGQLDAGQLDGGAADKVRSHVAACAQCRERLRVLEMESIWLRQSLNAESEADALPQRLLHPPRRRGAFWIWIPVLGLSAGGAYGAWSGFIAPWTGLAQTAGFTPGSLLTMLFFSGSFWKGLDAMREMTGLLAMGTLALLGMWLLLRHRRSASAAGAVMGVLALALAFAPSSKAAEIERGRPTYTLPTGQQVKTDLIVYAGTTRIDGDVDGDLIVWSREVTVNGHVKGDILAWGQDLRLNGIVDGNVRAWGQTLTVDSAVGKNLMTAAREVNLEDKSSVGGTVTAGAGNLALDGQVGGDLLAFTGDTEVDGLLGGNAVIHANRLVIGPQARIEGEAQYTGRRQAEVSPLARLRAPLKTTIFRGRNRLIALSAGRQIWRQILRWGASFVFGMVLLLLLPGFFLDIERACDRVLPALGFGVLFLFATPIAALIVCVTIVGLGVGLTSLLLWSVALYAAHIFVAAWVGDKVLPAAAGLGGLALGLLLLQAVEWVPYLGGWITFLVLIWGIGALVLGLHRRMQPAIAQ